MVFEVGRLVIKIAGRDARKKGVIVDVLENGYVMLDGQTRRKKCNISHLEPLNQVLKIKKGASNAEVVKALTEAGIECKERKAKETKNTERPRKQRKVKEKLEKKAKPKAEKKEKPKKEEKVVEKKAEAKVEKPKTEEKAKVETKPVEEAKQ